MKQHEQCIRMQPRMSKTINKDTVVKCIHSLYRPARVTFGFRASANSVATRKSDHLVNLPSNSSRPSIVRVVFWSNTTPHMLQWSTTRCFQQALPCRPLHTGPARYENKGTGIASWQMYEWPRFAPKSTKVVSIERQQMSFQKLPESQSATTCSK